MTFRIKSAEFLKSAPSLKEAPDLGGLPEFALVGRSNVGKSAFINSVLERKNLAQTSNTPGKTRMINFYPVTDSRDGRWLFVDLPGYGYAKVSKAEQARWGKSLEAFLKLREPLALVFQLIDARHGPQDSDCNMMDWLRHNNRPVCVILTKADKLGRQQVAAMQTLTAEAFGLPREAVLPHSAVTHSGREAVRQVIETMVHPPAVHPPTAPAPEEPLP